MSVSSAECDVAVTEPSIMWMEVVLLGCHVRHIVWLRGHLLNCKDHQGSGLDFELQMLRDYSPKFGLEAANKSSALFSC